MQVESLGWKDPPGGGDGNPLQYCCLENPMDRGAWRAAVHDVSKIWTQLSTQASKQAVYIVDKLVFSQRRILVF